MGTGSPVHRGVIYCRWMRTALAAAALAMIALAGCGGGNAVNTGPFGGDNYDAVSTCTQPSPPRGLFTAGDMLAFRNSGPALAVIDKVGFTHLHDLRLVAAYLVQNTGRSGGYGDRAGAPPPQRDLPPGVQWSHRQHADGAQIPPTPPKPAEVILVLVFQLTGASGTVSGVDLYYHTADGRYHMHVDRSLPMLTRGRSCLW